MARVIFLDRDGVINRERGEYTYSVSDFEIVKDLFEALNELKSRGFKFIVITNQGGISKQIYNHGDVISVHDYMRQQFEQAEVPLLDLYYCPHHNEIENCICRKPDAQLLEKAIAKYEVDVNSSYFIGDSDRDILAADKVGLKGVKVNANDSLLNYMEQFN